MSKLLYVKIGVLVAALAMIIYVITNLSAEGVSQSFEKMGLESSASPARAGAIKINLCPTRVHAIVWPDGRKIQEFKEGLTMKWQAYNLNPVDMGYMDMEKWLSLHCEVAASGLTEVIPAPEFRPLVTIEYIDGKKANLERSTSGLYRLEGQMFDSPDLTQGLENLITIANLQPLGP